MEESSSDKQRYLSSMFADFCLSVEWVEPRLQLTPHLWDLQNSTATDLVPGIIVYFIYFCVCSFCIFCAVYPFFVKLILLGTKKKPYILRVWHYMSRKKYNKYQCYESSQFIAKQTAASSVPWWWLLFKISKLSEIVTLCHQENTSEQKYKMINTFTKSGKFVQNKPVN